MSPAISQFATYFSSFSLTVLIVLIVEKSSILDILKEMSKPQQRFWRVISEFGGIKKQQPEKRIILPRGVILQICSFNIFISYFTKTPSLHNPFRTSPFNFVSILCPCCLLNANIQNTFDRKLSNHVCWHFSLCHVSYDFESHRTMTQCVQLVNPYPSYFPSINMPL